MTLEELRKARALSQEEVAGALAVNQPAVAKLEKRGDMHVSNLRRYVEALGGTLEITAHFDKITVVISNVGERLRERLGGLTFMSIEPILSEHLDTGRLVELASLFTGDETARTMIVSLEILAVVTPPFPDSDEGLRLGEFRAWLDSFMEGAEISVAEYSFQKPSDAMLSRVDPIESELWSIRVTQPHETPGVRSFGGFPARTSSSH